jgi:hypothetical protein
MLNNFRKASYTGDIWWTATGDGDPGKNLVKQHLANAVVVPHVGISILLGVDGRRIALATCPCIPHSRPIASNGYIVVIGKEFYELVPWFLWLINCSLLEWMASYSYRFAFCRCGLKQKCQVWVLRFESGAKVLTENCNVSRAEQRFRQ